MNILPVAYDVNKRRIERLEQKLRTCFELCTMYGSVKFTLRRDKRNGKYVYYLDAHFEHCNKDVMHAFLHGFVWGRQK